MIKKITEEQVKILGLLNDGELANIFAMISNDEITRNLVIKLTDEEKKFINGIINNCSLREEISKLGFVTILDYLEKKGFINLLGLFNKLEGILQSDYRNISRIEDIFTYIDFLLKDDMILEAVSGKEITDKARRSLVSLKKDILEKELSEITKKINDSKNKNRGLIGENDRLKKENESLVRSNSELSSKSNALSHSIEQLNSTRSSLLDENASLRQQIEDNRILLNSGLDKEIEAERIRRVSALNEEIETEKRKKSEELDNLNIGISKAKSDLEQIDSSYSRYCSDYPIHLGEEKESVEYDVVWEPIDENHELVDLDHRGYSLYYDIMKKKYKEITGKTDDEIKYDFEFKYPEFYRDFIVQEGLIRLRDYGKCNSIRSNISKCVMPGKLDALYEDLRKIRLPKYIKKERNSSYRDDINSLMLVIEAKKQIARANADKLIAEEALSYALNTFLRYLPENTCIDYLMALDEGLSSEGKRLVRELIRK